MKSATRFSLERVSGLALAALAIVAGAWAIYHFGPRPEKPISRQEVADQSASAPIPNRERARPALGANLFEALFKASTSPLASGRSGDAPGKYVESLEAIYRRRGYRKLDQGGGVDRQSPEKLRSQRLKQMRGKVYWRTDAGGVFAITAWGEDADPNAETTSAKTTNVKKQMYLTSVSPAEGGASQWTTYRYMSDASGLQAFNDQLQSDGDWPGQDPPDVPRAPGLKRLISVGDSNNQFDATRGNPVAGQSPTVMVVYQSQQRAEPLTEWYTKEMPMAGWRLNSPNGQSREKMGRALHFTKGHRSCLVWINPGAGADPTSVIINARAM